MFIWSCKSKLNAWTIISGTLLLISIIWISVSWRFNIFRIDYMLRGLTFSLASTWQVHQILEQLTWTLTSRNLQIHTGLWMWSCSWCSGNLKLSLTTCLFFTQHIHLFRNILLYGIAFAKHFECAFSLHLFLKTASFDLKCNSLNFTKKA